MKNLFFLLTSALWIFVSCEGPAGKDGIETYWFVKEYTIRANDWQLIGGEDRLGSYFQAQVTIPELDRDLYEKGHVFCYMFQTANNKEVQTILPFTVPKANNDGELWTETYSYDFSPGQIRFYFNCSDFYTSNRPPATTFRVVLNY